MKKAFAWILAIIITLSAVVYQRLTGPTNPLRVDFMIKERLYKTKLPRTLETLVPIDQPNKGGLFSSLSIAIKDDSLDPECSLYLLWKRKSSSDTLNRVGAIKEGGEFIVKLPSQPPAGKIIYFPILVVNNVEIPIYNEGVILRYKAPVPSYYLIPHIILMFVAMLISNFTAFAAIFNLKGSRRYALVTIILLFLGGLILGPLVQKAAFGDYWTGWPFGGDLTDTKTLFAFLIWVIAWFLTKGDKKRILLVVASLIMLLVYSIPHSTAGSDFNYEQGVVETGRGGGI